MTTTNTAISQYLITRIHEHAHCYAQAGDLIKSLDLTKFDTSLYQVMDYYLMTQLNQGHTVFSLDDSSSADNSLADGAVIAADLTKWQMALYAPIFGVVNEYLPEPVDFWQWLAELDRQTETADTAEIQRWMMDKLGILRQRLTQLTTLTARQLDDFLALTQAVCRIHYVLRRYQVQTLVGFGQMLEKSVFFDEIKPLSAGVSGHRISRAAPIRYRLNEDKLYLWSARAYAAESALMQHISRISSAKPKIFTVPTLAKLNAQQKQAAALTADHAFVMITGGPGTGKTFTVAQMVLALYADNPNLRLALAAPTGKAAQRMSESLAKAMHLDSHDGSADNGVGTSPVRLPTPLTIHRLLGIGRAGLPRFHADNQLALDVLIIDEASMLGTELATMLLSAVQTGSRVILLGDAQQLAAVDAGAVLADLCRMPMLAPLRVHLSESRRFSPDSGVGKLASIVHTPKSDQASQFIDLLKHDAALSYQSLEAAPMTAIYQQMIAGFMDYFLLTAKSRWTFGKLDPSAQSAMVTALFHELSHYRILCAAHGGMVGDIQINQQVAAAHRQALNITATASPWYHGRVVMATMNRYDLGLFNGDMGICLWTEDGMQVYFEGEAVRIIPVALLSDSLVQDAYAITIHKSQGSEWTRIAIAFDERHLQLLSTELIYTAITRAKSAVDIYSTDTAICYALSTPTKRMTGLGLVD